LHRGREGQVDRRLDVALDQRDVVDDEVILPGDVDPALGRQKAVPPDVQGQPAAAVDRQVEAAVR